jgi:hypothetical protein
VVKGLVLAVLVILGDSITMPAFAGYSRMPQAAKRVSFTQ